MPIVSVIIPTYNRFPFLTETIRSVREQTLSDLEVLVVADGHQPEVEQHIASLGDSRVRYIAIDHCGFPARPRNAGIRASSGRFLAFCDDDDVWLPEKLALQTAGMQQQGQNCGLCFTALEFIDEHGGRLDKPYEFHPRYHRATRNDFLLSLGFIANSSVMISREVVETVGVLDEDPALRAVEDYQYWSRILARYTACSIGQPLVQYRIHTGSIQPLDPWKWLRKQTYLHESIHRAVPIPPAVRLAKYTKLGIYALRLAVRRLLSGGRGG